ncbi:hypothetical protein BC830DRAFT_779920 [Chytriomyces sp. MP71]|nr:hypothetical protein BC830DRAFT_779920 [Chytriomyces sp. MP71]
MFKAHVFIFQALIALFYVANALAAEASLKNVAIGGNCAPAYCPSAPSGEVGGSTCAHSVCDSSILPVGATSVQCVHDGANFVCEAVCNASGNMQLKPGTYDTCQCSPGYTSTSVSTVCCDSTNHFVLSPSGDNCTISTLSSTESTSSHVCGCKSSENYSAHSTVLPVLTHLPSSNPSTFSTLSSTTSNSSPSPVNSSPLSSILSTSPSNLSHLPSPSTSTFSALPSTESTSSSVTSSQLSSVSSSSLSKSTLTSNVSSTSSSSTATSPSTSTISSTTTTSSSFISTASLNPNLELTVDQILDQLGHLPDSGVPDSSPLPSITDDEGLRADAKNFFSSSTGVFDDNNSFLKHLKKGTVTSLVGDQKVNGGPIQNVSGSDPTYLILSLTAGGFTFGDVLQAASQNDGSNFQYHKASDSRVEICLVLPTSYVSVWFGFFVPKSPAVLAFGIFSGKTFLGNIIIYETGIITQRRQGGLSLNILQAFTSFTPVPSTADLPTLVQSKEPSIIQAEQSPDSPQVKQDFASGASDIVAALGGTIDQTVFISTITSEFLDNQEIPSTLVQHGNLSHIVYLDGTYEKGPDIQIPPNSVYSVVRHGMTPHSYQFVRYTDLHITAPNADVNISVNGCFSNCLNSCGVSDLYFIVPNTYLHMFFGYWFPFSSKLQIGLGAIDNDGKQQLLAQVDIDIVLTSGSRKRRQGTSGASAILTIAHAPIVPTTGASAEFGGQIGDNGVSGAGNANQLVGNSGGQTLSGNPNGAGNTNDNGNGKNDNNGISGNGNTVNFGIDMAGGANSANTAGNTGGVINPAGSASGNARGAGQNNGGGGGVQDPISQNIANTPNGISGNGQTLGLGILPGGANGGPGLVSFLGLNGNENVVGGLNGQNGGAAVPNAGAGRLIAGAVISNFGGATNVDGVAGGAGGSRGGGSGGNSGAVVGAGETNGAAGRVNGGSVGVNGGGVEANSGAGGDAGAGGVNIGSGVNGGGARNRASDDANGVDGTIEGGGSIAGSGSGPNASAGSSGGGGNDSKGGAGTSEGGGDGSNGGVSSNGGDGSGRGTGIVHATTVATTATSLTTTTTATYSVGDNASTMSKKQGGGRKVLPSMLIAIFILTS